MPDIAGNLPLVLALVGIVVAAVTVREGQKNLASKVDDNHRAATGDWANLRAEIRRDFEAMTADLKELRTAVAEGSSELGRLEERIEGMRRDQDNDRRSVGELRDELNRRSLRRVGDT